MTPWTGLTRAGGIDMAAEVAGAVAIDEVVVHGWDLSVATGQAYACQPDLAAAAHGFVQAAVGQAPDGTPGLFGPPVRPTPGGDPSAWHPHPRLCHHGGTEERRWARRRT